ncbi:MAG: hypothetical protein ACI4QM_05480, partial [Alphaproteobacteria bacterium]
MTDAEIINRMITEQENKETIRRGEAADQKATEDAIADIEQKVQEGILQSNSELEAQEQQDSVIPPMEPAAPKSEEPIDTKDVARKIGDRIAQELTQEKVSDEAEATQETA